MKALQIPKIPQPFPDRQPIGTETGNYVHQDAGYCIHEAAVRIDQELKALGIFMVEDPTLDKVAHTTQEAFIRGVLWGLFNNDIDLKRTLHLESNDTDTDLTVTGNGTLNIAGNRTVAIDKNDTLTVAGNENQNVTGNRTVVVEKDDSLTVTGNGTLNIAGNLTITVTGNVTITAPLCTLTGNLNVTGNIVASGNITDGGTNTNHHSH